MRCSSSTTSSTCCRPRRSSGTCCGPHRACGSSPRAALRCTSPASRSFRSGRWPRGSPPRRRPRRRRRSVGCRRPVRRSGPARSTRLGSRRRRDRGRGDLRAGRRAAARHRAGRGPRLDAACDRDPGSAGAASCRCRALGPRDVPARQQTLDGTIAWSYELLPPNRRRLLRELTVFEGGFDLEQAAQVATLDPGDDLMDAVYELVDQSLVVRARSPAATARSAASGSGSSRRSAPSRSGGCAITTTRPPSGTATRWRCSSSLNGRAIPAQQRSGPLAGSARARPCQPRRCAPVRDPVRRRRRRPAAVLVDVALLAARWAPQRGPRAG